MKLDVFQTIDAHLFDHKPLIQPVNLTINSALCDSFSWMKPFNGLNIQFDILRADLNHNSISGNKWYKLRFWLIDYFQKLKIHHTKGVNIRLPLVSYGGAHSNHLVALASAASLMGIELVCCVRSNGQNNELLMTPSLQQIKAYGAQIRGISRREYRSLRDQSHGYVAQSPMLQGAYYSIPEGGQGRFGVSGVVDWLRPMKADFQKYNLLVSGVGTGVTFAGFLAALKGQSIDCLGVPMLRSRPWLASIVQSYLSEYGYLPWDTKSWDTKPWNRKDALDWRLDYVFSQKGAKPYDPKSLGLLAESIHCPVDPMYMPRVIQAMIWHYGRIYQYKPLKILLIHNGGLQAQGSAWPGAWKGQNDE